MGTAYEIVVMTELTVTGLRLARKQLGDLDMDKLGPTGQMLVRRFAPKKSGALAASVRVRRSRNRVSISTGSTAVPYAGAVNYGWRRRHIEPAGYMQKADRELRAIAPDQLDKSTQRALRQARLI